jgi:hypothetical protein
MLEMVKRKGMKKRRAAQQAEAGAAHPHPEPLPRASTLRYSSTLRRPAAEAGCICMEDKAPRPEPGLKRRDCGGTGGGRCIRRGGGGIG